MDIRSIGIIIGYILLFILVFSFLGFYLAIRPIKIRSYITPANYGLAYEKVSFKTKDGLLIKGWFIPSNKPHAKTIILLHGYPADKGNILPSRLFLHRNYHLLFLDFRYFGESGGHYSTVGKDEVLDVLAAIRYLKTKNIHEVGVWGFSMGGAVALMAAKSAPEIKAVVAESAYANLSMMLQDYYKFPFLRYPLALLTQWWSWFFLGYDVENVVPADNLQSLQIPLLIIHSERDQVVSFQHAQLFKKNLINNQHATFIFNKDLPHGYPFENYETTILEFFNKSLP